jgi:hypothetical protein
MSFIDPVTTQEDELFAKRQSTGLLTLYLVNAIIRPDDVPSTIHCNVYIGGGDDFEVNHVSNGQRFFPVAQGDCECVPATFNLPVAKQSNMSEKYTSLRQLAKRYVLAESANITAVTSSLKPIPFIVCVSRMIGLSTTNLDFDGAYATAINSITAMYRGWRGSTRFKLHITATDGSNDLSAPFTSSVYFSPYPWYDSPFFPSDNDSRVALGFSGVDTFSAQTAAFLGPPAVTFQTNGRSAGCYGAKDYADTAAPYHQLEIPFVSLNNFHLVPMTNGIPGVRAYDNTGPAINAIEWLECNDAGSIIGNISCGASDGDIYNVDTFVAIGDDFRCFSFLGPNLVRPNIVYKEITAMPIQTWPAFPIFARRDTMLGTPTVDSP